MFQKKIWKYGITTHYILFGKTFIRGKNFPLEVYVMENSVIVYTVILMLRKIIPFTNSIMYSSQCHMSL